MSNSRARIRRDPARSGAIRRDPARSGAIRRDPAGIGSAAKLWPLGDLSATGFAEVVAGAARRA